MAETRRFAGLATRAQLAAANNLSIVLTQKAGRTKFRNPELEVYDAYYEGRQYDGLVPWKQALSADNEYIPVRERAPSIQYRLGEMLVKKLSSKLLGDRVRPEIRVEDDPDTEAFLKAIIKQSGFFYKLMEPLRRELASGSCLVRFAIVNGQYKIEHFLGKWCYPQFDDNGRLIFCRIRYVYEDEQDLDEKKNPKKKWYQLDLGPEVDILYDNPEITQNGQVVEPTFKEVARVEHNLGFVQAEWFRPNEKPDCIDGDSFIEPIMGFIDELNYSLSQSSNAVSYNQDPQLTIKNMDEDDLEKLIRSTTKAWNLGREGEAQFLESQLEGVKTAIELRDKLKMHVQDITRIVVLDPEKIVGSAQSAKAMEVLHGPLVELIEDIRPQLEKNLNDFLLKMALATLILDRQGMEVPIEIPQGYQPKSIQITFVWPPIFPLTMEDLQKKVAIASSITTANILSRETMTKWLAKDFGVENIEEELAKIDSQKILNPYGSF